MSAVVNHIALVSEPPGTLSISELSVTSAAIQKQVMRDLAPHWDVQATVDAIHDLVDVPPGYWPVTIVAEDPRLPLSPIGGFHLDQEKQPFAVIQLSDDWQRIASHEILEMLVDPSGNMTRVADSPQGSPTVGRRVVYLVEVCDPSEAVSYPVNGIFLSDFYTPHYFDPVQAPGVQYSFTGAITAPLEVLRGGYLSWFDPVSRNWFQELFFEDRPKFCALGPLTEIGVSLRSQIDQKTRPASLEAMLSTKRPSAEAKRLFKQNIGLPSLHKAKALRAEIEKLKRAEIERLQASTDNASSKESRPKKKRPRSKR